MMLKAIAFTGHRPEKLPSGCEEALYMSILTELKAMGETLGTCYCGMAEGADTMFAACVVALMASGAAPHAKLVGVPAYAGKLRHPGNEWRLWIESGAAETVCLRERSHKGCYHERNRYIVDCADVLIAVYDGRDEGGTSYTVDYARSRSKPTLIIDSLSLPRTR